MAVIVIDPGHGGTTDVGGSSWNNAVGPAGTLEKTVTLAIAILLQHVLLSHGHTVAMTRITDVNLSLKDRAAVAKARNADAFVSIHCNGWQTPDVQGSETWLHSRYGEAGSRLAASLQPQLVAATGLRDRGIKAAGLGVLNPDYHAPGTAACLVEVSFLTDPVEERRLTDPTYQRRIATHLAAGVEAYLAQPALVARLLEGAHPVPIELEDAVSFAATEAAPTEPELWQKQSAAAEAALDFAIVFLGCRMGPTDDQILDTRATGKLRQIVRAVSLVESRHGTQGTNQPARDPFQCGNPGDAWWRELTGQAGNGSRLIRGHGLSNLWASQVASAAETTAGFNQSAALGILGDPKKGHKDSKFSPSHSYTWGIIYLIHRINTTAGQPSYACRDLTRQRLVDGAVEYNGGGVPDYKQRLEAALKEIGDIPPPLLALASEGFLVAAPGSPPGGIDEATRLVSNLVVTAGGSAQLHRVELRFETDGRLSAATIEFQPR